MSETLQLTRELIECESVTPKDEGCQDILIERLQALGFLVEKLPFGQVSNFWARIGNDGPIFTFAGHTDVVPPGPLEEWSNPPFTPVEKQGLLYGRGAADMKGSLAAMVTACERFLAGNKPKGSIAFLITSDEEGVAVDGTVKVMNWLAQNSIHLDYCLVGEPSSEEKLGDTIKIGRRGSLNGDLTVNGIQGHVAYPQLADNPVHKVLLPLAELSQRIWDEGNESFPPTTFQISNVNSGTGATNVIPDSIRIQFNFRFSTEQDEIVLKQRVENLLNTAELDFDLQWELSGNPFITRQGELIDTVTSSIKSVIGIDTVLSTSGGTSDGRFIAPTGSQVVELGPCNHCIHKVDEHVSIDDLHALSELYSDILQRLL